MAWGSKTDATQLTSVSTVQYFTTTPTLNPGEVVHCEVQGNSSGTTDNLLVEVFGTLDASGENWDDVPIMSFEIDCTSGNDEKASFVMKDIYKFRIGVTRVGSTDTFTADFSYRADGVSL